MKDFINNLKSIPKIYIEYLREKMEITADSVVIIDGHTYAGDYIIKLMRRREKELEQWRVKAKRHYKEKVEDLRAELSAIIYKLYTDINDESYIGTTTSSIEIRLKGHFSNFNRCSSKDLIDKYGKENIKYEILEKCNADDRYEREQYWINHTINCVNRQISSKLH